MIRFQIDRFHVAKHVIGCARCRKSRRVHSPAIPFRRWAAGWRAPRPTARCRPRSHPAAACEHTTLNSRTTQRTRVRHRTTQHFRNLFDNRSLATPAYLSRWRRQIRSLATFNFFETSFLRCSTVFLPLRLIEKLLPVVVCIFSVMSVDWGEPHPYTSVPVARSMFYTYRHKDFCSITVLTVHDLS